MTMPTANASWRDSVRFPRFLIFDSRAVFPLFGFILHIRWWTFITAVVVMLFFSLLLRYGFTLGIFGRLVRSALAGKHKSAKPWWVYGYK